VTRRRDKVTCCFSNVSRSDLAQAVTSNELEYLRHTLALCIRLSPAKQDWRNAQQLLLNLITAKSRW
jgi:hypothetical protein